MAQRIKISGDRIAVRYFISDNTDPMVLRFENTKFILSQPLAYLVQIG